MASTDRTHPAGPGAAALLATCVAAATAAPSIHNTQPWRFRIRDGGVDVAVDPVRRLAVVDPTGREMYLSVGAALFNLRVSVRALGRLPVVRPPDVRRPGAVARVTLGPATAADGATLALAAAIRRRRTNRLPYAEVPVPVTVIDELRAAAAAEGATMSLPGAVERGAILSLIRTAHTRQLADPAYRHELDGWTRSWPGRRDGVPRQAFGPRDAQGSLPARDFTGGRGWAPTAQFERHPTLAILGTCGDAPEQWLRAGQALQRVLLTATVRGLSAQPMTQPLEVPELRDLLVHEAIGRQPQVILRLGYGRPVSGSPRRRLAEVLDHPGRYPS